MSQPSAKELYKLAYSVIRCSKTMPDVFRDPALYPIWSKALRSFYASSDVFLGFCDADRFRQWFALWAAYQERDIFRQVISMRDLYRLASMHQRAWKHGNLSPLSFQRFCEITGERGVMAWVYSERSQSSKHDWFDGWLNRRVGADFRASVNIRIFQRARRGF